MEHLYTPENVCPMQIKFQLDGNVVSNIEFVGGCNGNLKAIAKLVDGWTIEQIEEKLAGNTCGRRPTSCADQLSKAVRTAYNSAN